MGGNSERSNIDMTHDILNLMGYSEEKIDYVTDRLGHDLRYAIDYSKAKSDLGFEPKISLNDGLSATIEWYKNNHAWWDKIKK